MRPFLPLTLLAFTGPLAAAHATAPTAPQNAGHHTATSGAAAHHTPAVTAAKPAGPPCATGLPTLPSTIPALPASAGCPKVLFTVSDRLDYLNPIAERFKSTLFAELPVVISLDYADISIGTGELARPQQYYTVKYTGYLPDGTKFDSSEDHEETKTLGFTFPYGAHRVIAGWDLGFEGMHIGGKRRLYVPYQFAYGAGGQPPKIPPKSMLIFDMELLSQSSTPPAPPTPPVPPMPPTGAPSTPPAGGSPNGSPGSGPDTKSPPPVAGQSSGAPGTSPTDTKPGPPQ